MGMDDFDAKLVERLQTGVPLVPQPWRNLAEALETSTENVTRRIEALRRAGLIRRIGGLFDADALGYRQTLAALRVLPDRLAAAGEIVSAHPGVSHCYSRADEFNLWFTLAVSLESALGVSETLVRFLTRTQARGVLNLPTVRRVKLAVRFARNGAPTCLASAPGRKTSPPPRSDEQKRAIRALQGDLPTTPRPFDDLARRGGADSGEALLVAAADALSAGWMRRYAAVVDHRAAGAKANVLVVWRLSRGRIDLAVAAVDQNPAISHGYLRETAPGWPFNLYTMFHGRSPEQCARAIESVAAVLAHPERRELRTTQEFKKSPVRFFTDEEAQWEASAR